MKGLSESYGERSGDGTQDRELLLFEKGHPFGARDRRKGRRWGRN